MSLDLFIQSFLCVVFTLLGVLVKGFFAQKKKENWKNDITFAFVAGLLIFFGKSLLLKTWTDQFQISALCSVMGIIGPALFSKIVKNPLPFIALFTGKNVNVNENENQK